jgi:hypothetical protein
VNQQSEHLSDAQIEEYGMRTSGVEPVGEEEVEKHLDHCPSCRCRVLEFQRANLGLISAKQPLSNFAYPSEDVERGSPGPHRIAATNHDAACPSEDELRRLAAGLSPDASGKEMVRHAADCQRCGPLLRAYTEDFSGDYSAEERSMLAQLSSASPQWQEQTARKMLHQAAATRIFGESNPALPHEEGDLEAKPLPPALLSRFWKLTLVPVCIVCVLAALSAWQAQRNTPEKVERLLAQAYTLDRTTEMRWPGAAWGAYSVSLGEKTKLSPDPLLNAKNVLENLSPEELKSARWVRAVAEKEIAAGTPAGAVALLEQAAASGTPSVQLSLDLAMAHFAQAEQAHDQKGYERSRQILDAVLQQQPGNTVARFNRALVHERLKAPDKAAADWRVFLDTETDAAWRDEARKHLEYLQQIQGVH